MENGKRLWIAMVVLCACARLLPHPWNFTPLMAIGLFSGYQARKAATGILVTLSALALSDVVLGFDSGFWFVYAAALVAVLFGRITRNRGARRDCRGGAGLQPVVFSDHQFHGVGHRAHVSQYAGGPRRVLHGRDSLLPESIRGRRVLHAGAFRRLRAAEALVPSGSTRPPSVRVVSLLAGATEMVCALGAGEMLVGRSHECDNPSWVRRLPSCSQPAFDVSVSSGEIDAEVRRRLHAGEPLYHIDMELIRELAAGSGDHAVALRRVRGDTGRFGTWRLRHCRAPTFALGRDHRGNLPAASLQVAEALGLPERGHAPWSIASGSV